MPYAVAPGRSTLLSRALDLIYPPRCVACGAWGAWLCAKCVSAIVEPEPPLCWRCGSHSPHGVVCRACQRMPSYCDGIRSAALHLYPLREAIHALKYEGIRVLVEPLGQILAQRWMTWIGQEHHLAEALDAVPVPLHPSRVRHRGYNQASLLGLTMAAQCGLTLHDDWLERLRDTRSQVGLAPAERWENVAEAFHCPADAEIAGKQVVLIDDVMTTGATLEACAKALRQAGASAVWGLTLTRAPGRRWPAPWFYDREAEMSEAV